MPRCRFSAGPALWLLDLAAGRDIACIVTARVVEAIRISTFDEVGHE
jgi:hypothetical protein